MGEDAVAAERGETLIEVMVAVVLTGLVVLGLVGTMTTGLIASQRLADARNLDTALGQAVAELEAAPFASSYTLTSPRNNAQITIDQIEQVTTRLQVITVTATYASLSRTQTVVKSKR